MVINVKLVYYSRPNLAIGTIRRGFGKFPVVFYVWCLMKGSALGVYPAFCYWANCRVQWPSKCNSIEI